jgi:hypothetical protein
VNSRIFSRNVSEITRAYGDTNLDTTTAAMTHPATTTTVRWMADTTVGRLRSRTDQADSVNSTKIARTCHRDDRSKPAKPLATTITFRGPMVIEP